MGSHDWAGASIFVNMDKYPVVSIWLLGSFSLVFWCLGRDEKPIKLIENLQVLTSRTSSLKDSWAEKREIKKTGGGFVGQCQCIHYVFFRKKSL